MSWEIDKQFSFCYGHRVWVQKLEHDFCARGDTKTKCRHLHGHEGLVHVFLESETLNDQGMCTDFKHLGWLKNFLDDNLDHKFILDMNDPWFDNIIKGHIRKVQTHTDNGVQLSTALEIVSNNFHRSLPLVPVIVPGTNHTAGYQLDVSGLDGPEHEFYEGFFLVDFVPTSENLSRWLFDIVQEKMNKIGVKTSRIDWFETPKSRASYSG